MDIIDLLMLDLETIIILATMAYIIDSFAYELHPRVLEQSSTTLLMHARDLHYMTQVDLCSKNTFVYLC